MKYLSDTHQITRSFFWAVLSLSLLVAAVKRLLLIAPPGFPLGEGGLFVLFSQTILGNDFAMPAQIVYGGVTLPFAYPPAAFYLGAAAAKATGADLLDVYYWLPIALNLLAVPAFCILAAQLTRDRIVFLCAAILYVQLPESFMWQITGGGLPRALAALFALSAVGLALRTPTDGSRTDGSRKDLLLSGLCIGLAILSHLEWGMFAAVGVTLAFFTRAEFKKAALLTAAAGLISFLTILPWLLAVLSQHGLDPFLSSSSASAWNIGSFLSTAIRGRMFGIIIWPAILGAVILIGRGQWFLVSWIVMAVLLTPRMGVSAGYGIPASLLAGYGFKAAGEFAYGFLTSGRSSPVKVRLAERPWFGAGALALAPLLFFSLIYATPIPALYHRPVIVEQVGEGSREAMLWIRGQTDPRGSFVVISGAEEWYLDRIAEWFPFLAGRRSLTTAQGLEWAGPDVFAEKTREITRFKFAQAGAPELMPAFVQAYYCAADYVAVFSAPASAERQSFLASRMFQPVFANQEAAVFRRLRTEGKCEPAVPPAGSLVGSPRNSEAL
jgi:hypothetical protein